MWLVVSLVGEVGRASDGGVYHKLQTRPAATAPRVLLGLVPRASHPFGSQTTSLLSLSLFCEKRA